MSIRLSRPLAWEDGITQTRAVLSLISTLPDLLGFEVRTIADVSNLTTGAVKGNLVFPGHDPGVNQNGL